MGIRGKRVKKELPAGYSLENHSVYQRIMQFIAWQLERNTKELSLQNRRNRLLQFLAWCDERGLTDLQEISMSILERYQRHLFLYRKKNGEPLGVTTQCDHLIILRSFFKWLTKRHILPSNPAADLEMPKRGERLPKDVLSQQEVETLLAFPDISTPKGLRDRAMLELFYGTGMRRAELASLTVSSINHEAGTVMIIQGKNRKDRMIPVSARACYWVRQYQEQARSQWVGFPESDALFLSTDGQAVSLENLSTHVGQLFIKSGVRQSGSCHLLRHTMATLMLENGADLRWIQAMLGHSSILATQIYTKVSIKALREIYNATHPSAALNPRSNALLAGEARDLEHDF
jgi:integrase/recombinase XerD